MIYERAFGVDERGSKIQILAMQLDASRGIVLINAILPFPDDAVRLIHLVRECIMIDTSDRDNERTCEQYLQLVSRYVADFYACDWKMIETNNNFNENEHRRA